MAVILMDFVTQSRVIPVRISDLKNQNIAWVSFVTADNSTSIIFYMNFKI